MFFSKIMDSEIGEQDCNVHDQASHDIADLPHGDGDDDDDDDDDEACEYPEH